MTYANAKFDPEIHAAIVQNIRQQWKRKKKKDLKMPDKMIFDIWRDLLVYELEENQTHEDIVIDEIELELSQHYIDLDVPYVDEVKKES